MNIPENIESDYIEFLLTLSICSLNEEEKKINKILNNSGENGWTLLQKQQKKQFLIYQEEILPLKNQPRWVNNITCRMERKNTKERKQNMIDYNNKINQENKKYKINKDLFLRLIDERKKVLINETKKKAFDDITCECGLLSKRKHISTHRKLPIHIKLMAIAKETQLCTEIKPITKEIPIIKETPIITKEIPIKEIEEIEEEEEEEEESDDGYNTDEQDEINENEYYNLPLIPSEYQLENFRENFRVKWNTELFIKKNIEYRKKWNIDNNVLRPIYKQDENGNETKEVIGIE